MATRQTHDKTFKQEAVRLVQTNRKSQRQIADDLGIGLSTLSLCWLHRRSLLKNELNEGNRQPFFLSLVRKYFPT
jgi:transposase-like protein